MGSPPSPCPRWATALPLLLTRLREDRDEASRVALWRVLHAGLLAALRSQAGSIVGVSTEDLEDMASDKALELLEQAEGSRWGEASRSGSELAGYVWRVARNALVDLARRRGREAAAPEDEAAWDRALESRTGSEVGPLEWTVAQEFSAALTRCVEKLTPRARMAWWLRAGLERPSVEIASRLGVRPAHVDVIVQRARAGLQRCMADQGHAVNEVHPQVFVLLWASPWNAGEDPEVNA